MVAWTIEEWASVLIGAGPATRSSLSRVSVQWRQAGKDRNELICSGSEWFPKPLRCHGLQPVVIRRSLRPLDLLLSQNGPARSATEIQLLANAFFGTGLAFSHPCIGGINMPWEPA